MSEPTITDGARALGVSEDEVTAVADSPAGLVVITKDEARYIVVPDDHPDDAGKTGVMFLVPPVLPYHGTFPVFSQPAGPIDEVPAEADAAVIGIPGGTIKEVLDWVGEDDDRAAAALEAEQAKGEKARAGLVKELGERLVAAAERSAATPTPVLP